MTSTPVIDVYSLPTGADVDGYNARYKLLNQDERERAARFKYDHHRETWVNSRAALRQIVSKHSSVEAQNVVFTRRPDGKPEIASTKKLIDGMNATDGSSNHASSPLFFNLSHSGHRALVAVCDSHEVGCDVEHVKRIRDWHTVTRRFFSPKEQEELANVQNERQKLAFYLCWTRKEAVIKATGEGLRADLCAFDVSLTPGEKARVYEDRQSTLADPPWQLVHVEAGSDYVGAVAVRSTHAPDVVIHTGWKTLNP